MSAMPISKRADETVFVDAHRLVGALDWLIHDCAYLVLAARLDTELVTADACFPSTLAGTRHGDTVTLPGEGVQCGRKKGFTIVVGDA